MNSEQERRVVEALQALTGGLTVTEHDTLTAQNRLKDNLEPPSPRRKLALVAAAAAALTIVGYVAVQAIDDPEDDAGRTITTGVPSAGDRLAEQLQDNAYGGVQDDFLGDVAPSQSDFEGLWLLRTPSDGVLFVDGDGDWGHYGAPGNLIGRSTLDGRTWTRHVRDHCGGKKTIPFTAGLAGDGSLHLLFTGSVNECTPAGDREVWDRLVPGPSPVMDYFRDSLDDVTWTNPRASWSWEGEYVDAETGSLLVVEADRTYALYADLTGADVAPSDEGLIGRTADRGQLTASCSAGGLTGRFEVGMIPEAPGLVDSRVAVRVDSADDACGLAGDQVWVELF